MDDLRPREITWNGQRVEPTEHLQAALAELTRRILENQAWHCSRCLELVGEVPHLVIDTDDLTRSYALCERCRLSQVSR